MPAVVAALISNSEVIPRKLYAKTRSGYKEIGEVYPKSKASVLRQLRKMTSGRHHYRCDQIHEELVISKIGARAYQVLGLMRARSEFKNRVKKFQIRDVAELLGANTRTISRAISELKRHGIIIQVGTGFDKAYYINPDLIIKGSPESLNQTAKLFSHVRTKNTSSDLD